MLPFNVLQETLKNLRLPDGEMLKRGSLAPLAKTFEAYPVHQNGKKLCVLVPIGLKPKAASLLEESQLATRVVVLAHEDGKWAKVWPNLATNSQPTPQQKEEVDEGLKIEFVED